MDNQTLVRLVLIIIAALVLFAIVSYYNRNKTRLESEKFSTSASDSAQSGGNGSDAAVNNLSPGAYAAAMPRAQNHRIKDAPDGYKTFNSPSGPVSANEDGPGARGSYLKSCDGTNTGSGDGMREGFTNSADNVKPLDPLETEQYRPVDFGNSASKNNEVNTCYPSDSQYRVDELLPKDAANTKWAQVNPAGQGDVKDQNFLTAGYHVGVNTVGTSLRNASHDIRGEIPNPRVNVSPWNQSTIGPDLNKRVLEGFDQPIACRGAGNTYV